MNAAGQAAGAAELRAAVSAALTELYSVFSGHDHVTAAAYITDKLSVSMPESTLAHSEAGQVRELVGSASVDCGVAFQTERDDQPCDAVERLAHRRGLAFMSQGHTTSGVTCELLFDDAASLAGAGRALAHATVNRSLTTLGTSIGGPQLGRAALGGGGW